VSIGTVGPNILDRVLVIPSHHIETIKQVSLNLAVLLHNIKALPWLLHLKAQMTFKQRVPSNPEDPRMFGLANNVYQTQNYVFGA
jgi:hypothetical protein